MFRTIRNRLNLQSRKSRAAVSALVCAMGLALGFGRTAVLTQKGGGNPVRASEPPTYNCPADSYCTSTGTLPASMPARGKSSMKNTLLNALQALRAANRSRVKSGYGVAKVKTTFISNPFHENRPLPRRVEFWFSNNRCFWKAYSRSTPHRLLGSTLIRNGLVIRFYRGRGPARYYNSGKFSFGQFSPSVGIEPVDTYQSWTTTNGDGRPLFWTYSHLTEIGPHPWERPERAFFLSDWPPQPLGLTKPFSTVRKSGHLIKVKVISPPNPKVGWFGQKDTALFDILDGGMVKMWRFSLSELTGRNKDRSVRQNMMIKTTWRRAGNYYFPKTRTMEIHTWFNGKCTEFARTRIRFVKFVAVPVNKDVFTVKNMHILKGTLVFDNVHRDRYYYSPATAAWMLGREKPSISNHTPGGN